jgi:hypothetical protein
LDSARIPPEAKGLAGGKNPWLMETIQMLSPSFFNLVAVFSRRLKRVIG